MDDLHWPDNWQPEAIEAVLPFVGTDHRLAVDLGTPDLRFVARMAGHVHRGEDGAAMIIHDHSGGPGIYPWALLNAKVMQISLLRPRLRPKILYRHPGWTGQRAAMLRLRKPSLRSN